MSTNKVVKVDFSNKEDVVETLAQLQLLAYQKILRDWTEGGTHHRR